MTKLKAFEHKNLNVTQKIEEIVGNGENAGINQHFLLYR